MLDRLRRPSYSSRIGIALAATLFLLGIPAVSEALPPGPSECMSKYTIWSGADDTCRNENVTVVGYQCQFTAECRNSEGDWVNTQISVTPEEATQLNNCNGVLTLGSC